MVGSGDRVNFWSDIKVDDRRLKDAFLRCHALAVLKNGTENNFGFWVESNWVWNIPTRRPLIGWEEDQWQLFLTFLDCFKVHKNRRDSIAWSVNTNGLFSVGTFRRSLEDAFVDEDIIPKLLWKGICPPKANLFMWQLWKGKIMVRELLFKYGMTFLPNLECPLCNSCVESIDHLFLNCFWSSLLWRMCMEWWGVQCCLNNSVKLWLEEWSGLCPAFKHERAWNSLFCAIIWSIWESKNKRVFDNIEPNVLKVYDVVKFRVVWWLKYLGKGSSDAIQSLLINVKDFCIEPLAEEEKNHGLEASSR
ncbi:hypothetical protein Ddye_025537 [Dipteronia dyeriana]|uniref:Reverse transcriptase zinc-binding domain-containing protein n=1 Tax=Dipteronia dyeriana TaxID=168575 RepID=A0AAD9WPI3_9ROSI|nr:hypothetical protein Ddye_025537 [Dipteronia dyeriana]